MKLHIRLLLTRSTGASPQAPKHSPSTSVTLPSEVVSPKPMPSFCFRYSADSTASCSAQGRFVQIVILNVPSGLQVVHRVERRHLVDGHRRHAQVMRDEVHRLRRQPAVLVLRNRERRHHRRFLTAGWVLRDLAIDLLERVGGEHRGEVIGSNSRRRARCRRLRSPRQAVPAASCPGRTGLCTR